jgi:two-component system, OmpR family, response regulator ChvI
MDMSSEMNNIAQARELASVSNVKLRVIVVDDDALFCEMVTAELEEHGFSVKVFADGQALLRNPDIAVDTDIIVLDWNLPHIQGIDLLPRMHKLGINVPVVFLTGRPRAIDEAMAFDRGAVDFVDKSRGVAILVHRLRVAAQAKGTDLVGESSYRCGRLVLQHHVSRAFWDDVDVDLTVGEFRIVHLLARNVGQYVGYRAIYDELRHRGFISGNGENGYRSNVRSAVKRIRRKFEKHDPQFDEIHNFMAFGYVWGQRSKSNGAA